jgi:hypothetical protein
MCPLAIADPQMNPRLEVVVPEGHAPPMLRIGVNRCDRLIAYGHLCRARTRAGHNNQIRVYSARVRVEGDKISDC